IIKKATATEADKLLRKDEFNISFSLPEEVTLTENLLTVIPAFSNTVQYFVENPEVANWAEQGIVIHEGKQDCEFCGNSLSAERFAQIIAHFSADLKNHKNDLENLIENMRLRKLDEPNLQKSDIYKELWTDFVENDQSLKKEIKHYNKQV